MSSAHAIAATTKVLVSLVDDAFKAAKLADVVGGDVTVSALSPKRVDLSKVADPNQFNIFLYLALPNSGGSGFDLPTRNSAGARVENTPLALDLYYLTTAYGVDDYFAEMILGHAMQVLHENPILARDAIRAKLKSGNAPSNADLALEDSGLADQAEQLKVSQEKLSTEDISRIWTACGAEYRPSVAYRVTVILIQGHASTRTVLPVQRRGIYLETLSSPWIDKIMAKSAADKPASEDEPILAGYILVLVGTRLRADITSVLIDGVKTGAVGTAISSDNVSFPLPDTLRAGPHGVQIVHEVDMGSPAVAHPGGQSNTRTFLLRPSITNTAVDGPNQQITVTVGPLVTVSQKVRAILNDTAPTGNAFSFEAPKNNGIDVDNGETETDTITFDYKDVPAGDYLLRIQVDGADSVLETDPNTGAFNAPKITIP